jgi:hypothetical protein
VEPETRLEPTRLVLARPPCEWCSSPYRFKAAALEVTVPIGGATARLCLDCAENFPGPRAALMPAADAARLITVTAAAAYVEAEKWTAAKTVPEDPHEYLLLRVSSDPWMHLRVLRFIKATGERRQWAKDRAWYRYWQTGGHEYWGMPRESDTLLNRRVKP